MKVPFEILTDGLLTLTTQRPLDLLAAQAANSFVGNNAAEAVTEITLMGPKIKFLKDTVIAICGADLSPSLNQQEISNNKAYAVKANDVLSFGKDKAGVRSYLACGNSMSDGIPYQLPSSKFLSASPAPEFSRLPQHLVAALFSHAFSVSKLANRMGVQLEQRLANDLSPIITSPVMPGTVQLTTGGRLIVLLADCQITGGYPRILQLDASALAIIAQASSGCSLRFSSRQ